EVRAVHHLEALSLPARIAQQLVVGGHQLTPFLRDFAAYAITHSCEQQSCAERQSRMRFEKLLPHPAQVRVVRAAPMFPVRQGVGVWWPTLKVMGTLRQPPRSL